MRNKNTKTKARVIRTSKTTRSSIWDTQEIHFIDSKSCTKMEEKHEISKKKPLLANRVSDDIERAAIGIATEFPAYGQCK